MTGRRKKWQENGKMFPPMEHLKKAISLFRIMEVRPGLRM
jgi:hypothetical protein